MPKVVNDSDKIYLQQAACLLYCKRRDIYLFLPNHAAFSVMQKLFPILNQIIGLKFTLPHPDVWKAVQEYRGCFSIYPCGKIIIDGIDE